MPHNLINLLPEGRVKAFRREYFIRLVTITIFLLGLLTVIHGVMLFPAYLSLLGKRDAKAAELASVTANGGGSEVNEVNTRLAALKGDATYLARLSNAPSASATLRAVLIVPRPGIHITSITFTPPSGNATNGKMMVAGIATTREALRAYDLALAALPFVSNADLPIGAYANEADISFTVTLTGTLTP